MKKRFSLWAMCLLFAIVFMLPQAAHACDATTLTGPWAYFLSAGFDPQPHGKAVNTFSVAVGTFVGDGAGNFTDSDTTLNLVPLFFGLPAPNFEITKTIGYYTVNANCTGTLTFHINNLSVHFDFFLFNATGLPNTGMTLIASDLAVFNVVAGTATHI